MDNISNKKIAVFGCKSTTKFLLENIPIAVDYVITISPELGALNQVADYYDIKKLLDYNVYQSKTYSLKSDDDYKLIKSLSIDIAFVIGWQRIIPSRILKTFSIGAFGMHGSCMDLPLGRGRSPMNWSIIEDRKCFYTNLFKYDPGIDSGDILDTVKFNINDHDTGETMHYKNVLSMCHLIKNNLQNLLSGKLKLRKQKNITPTYYPKRKPSDSLIDWSMHITDLDRFIRAVAKPFNGAYSYNSYGKVIIDRAQILDTNYFGYDDTVNGQVLEIFSNEKFIVKANGGILLVNEFEGKIDRGDILNNGDEEINYFKLNKYGYYDNE